MPEPTEPVLRVIEPNLAGHSGHYAEFVGAVAARSSGVFAHIDVFGAARAAGLFRGHALVRMHGVFDGKRAREAQVLGQAVAGGDPFLVLTARAVHAPLLAWLARGAARDSLRNARLYFHWREQSVMQRTMMAAAPGVRQRAVAIAPTQVTADFLRGQGWARVAQVPYPILPPAEVPPPQKFRHLLVAGAARMNKGLDLVAGLAELLAARGDETTLLVQTTPKRVSGKRGTREEEELARLLRSGARGLVASDDAPDTARYGARFEGALVLAPYDPAHFADNVSGVVLDALLRGAPVVASAGSWPGRIVERFGAGAIFAERTPEALADAVQRVLGDWDGACARAQKAARDLAVEHDPEQLVRVLRDGV